MALQLTAERLQAAIDTAGAGELVAVLFVKIPGEQAVTDQATRELIGNRGVVQEYISGRHADELAALEMSVDDPEL